MVIKVLTFSVNNIWLKIEIFFRRKKTGGGSAGTGGVEDS